MRSNRRKNRVGEPSEYGRVRGQNVLAQPKQKPTFTGIVEPWAPVFPARTKRKLRYSTNISLTSTSGVVATYVFSANGLFDPDISGTGHQPMGFDQLMLSYNHYTVTDAKIRCIFKNTTSSVPTVSIRVHPDTAPVTVIDQSIEYGLINTDALEIKGSYGANKEITEVVSIRKAQGVQDVLDVIPLSGTAAANPAEQTYFHVSMWDSSGTSGSCNVDVIIEYVAWFTEPRVLTPSLLKQISSLVRLDDDEKKKQK
jgi:hypothetical protein